MKNQKKRPYAPNQRDFLEAKPKIVKAYSSKDFTTLPDNVQDPIVSNNIANQEFNYTYNNEEDI